MGALLDEALFYRQHKIVAIPLHPRSKLPYFKWRYWANKMPGDKEYQHWFADDSRNIGVICGGSTNLVVIDFDTPEGFIWWGEKCLQDDGVWRKVLEDGYKVRSARGFHVYVRSEQRVESRELKLRGIGIRSHNHYVLVPPSVHPCGECYQKLGEFILYMVDDLQEFLEIPPIEKRVVQPLDEIWDADVLIQRDSGTVKIIKQANPILSYVSRLTQMECKSLDGRWWYGRCISPYHEDKHPSFRVDNLNGVCCCMTPSCSLFEERGLDVIALHARLNGMSNKEAIDDLYLALETQTLH